MAGFDIIIRNGTLVDGTGGEPYIADIAISGNRIAAIGDVREQGAREIDAARRIVTPGFVDVHTHYDGQATWTSRLTPSSTHGVTTAIMGNCGVGFAPCRPEDRQQLIRLMDGIEDIPEVVLSEGLPWDWESYPDYLDHIARNFYDINIGGYLPHSALRVYAMGRRGLEREPATPADIARMRRMLGKALEAGAFGLATSQSLFHRASDGRPIPTLDTSIEEMTGLAAEIKAFGRGVFQCVIEYEDIDHFLGQVGPVARDVGIPLFFSMSESNHDPAHSRRLLDRVAELNRLHGTNVKAQIFARGVGFILGHHLTLNPFSLTETYKSLGALEPEERLAALRDPAIKARILSEPAAADPRLPLAVLVRDFTRMFPLGDPPDYEPAPETSIATAAARLGIPPEALAYDLLLEKDGRNCLYLIVNNYADMSLEGAREIMLRDDTILGLGDAGAHCGTICDGAYPTFMLTHWVRDRDRGARVPLAWAVKALSRDTAAAIGLDDRGILAPGYRADLNIIDLKRLRLRAPELVFDMPGNSRRLLQRADGYDYTIVGGVITYRDGEPTGALPGRLVRGPQPAPSRHAASWKA